MTETNNDQFLTTLFIIALAMLFMPTDILASTTGMPWESELEKIKNSISGPVAGVISLIGVVAAGSMLLFGNSGDFGGTFKVIVWMVLVISMIITANVLIAQFTASGAVIT
ncbi:MAG: TrbC/VirB2 family protein [Sulfurovum sp.]|nr:TrbC/VirB2 family protein [Sulfurovum sp.]